MTLRRVEARWVNEKLDFRLKLHIFFRLFVQFKYVLFYLSGLFAVKTCVSIL